MKTLAGWIVGVFALGLVVGGLYRGISAEEVDTSAVSSLPDVDCGSGREALYEPVTEGATTTLRVRCVSVETEPAPRRTAAAVSPYVAAPAPVAVAVPVAASSTPAGRAATPVSDPNAEASSRSWEKSALIIGSAAGAGAGIGALAKGGKGAAVGAAVGGVAGTVYDLATRNKKK